MSKVTTSVTLAFVALCVLNGGCPRQAPTPPASQAGPTGRAQLNRLQPQTREELGQQIGSSPLARVASDLEALILDEIALVPEAAEEDAIQVGASKLGGCPDLPAQTEWPEWTGIPLGFIAQFRLSQVAPYDPSATLPREGMLYFFYDGRQETWGLDPGDRGAWRVLYHATEGEGLNRAKPPEDLPSESRFASCALTPRAAASLPFSETLPEVQALKLSDAEEEGYSGLIGDPFGTKLLGYAEYIQDDMRLGCELGQQGIAVEDGQVDPQALAASTHWRLLLQVDSEDEAGMMWGDAGMLYYWIRDDDLATRHFDNVWLALQCY